MKGKKKKAVMIAVLVGMIFSMLGFFPVVEKAQAEDAFQVVPVMNISRPSEVEDLVAVDKGLAFQMTGSEAKHKFTINERGWLIMKCYFKKIASYNGAAYSTIYTNASLSKMLGQEIKGSEGQSKQANYYVDAGTYYISHEKSNKDAEQIVFLYFIPESSIAQSNVESTANGTKISVSFTPDRATAKILNDKYSVDKINHDVWKNATTMVDNTYTTTATGDFTIKGEFASEEWKDFPVLLNVTVEKSAGVPVTSSSPAPIASSAPGASAQPASSAAPSANVQKVTKITLKEESMTLAVGDEKKISFTTEPAGTKAEELEWFSSDEDVAEVAANGKITAVSSGKAEITVQTKDGKVSAAMTITVKPQKVEVTSVKSSKKKITLKWERQENIGGYQVNYSLKNDFSGAKSKNMPAKSSSVTLKNLKSKKYYYLRIRAYQTVDGKKYYSEWSKASKIKVK